jgi:hypothetical protein
MARGGRPKADEGDRGTRQVRVFDDVADMLSLLVRVLGTNTAQLLDPMIRPDLESLYEQHRPAIEQIKAAEERLRTAEAQLRQAVDDAARQAAAKPKPKQTRG